jgi:spectinomycin phosphotransferase
LKSVRCRPPGITDDQIVRAIADGWGFHAGTLSYVPIGAGSYNWIATDRDGRRRFVKVDDLDDKPWLGRARPQVLAGLRAALTAAVRLRAECGLRFVVAPILGINEDAIRLLTQKHGISVYPYLAGQAGKWGDTYTSGERAELAHLLTVLHQQTIPVPETPLDLPGPDALTHLPAADAEQANILLSACEDLAGHVRALPKVLTHGEPHPGNVMWVDGRLMLLDWDTVGFAPAERDTWLIRSGPETEPERFFRLRWQLTDLIDF